MRIFYSEHAKIRIKQRGISRLEVQHVLEYPHIIKKSYDKRLEAIGKIKNRDIKIIYRLKKPNVIKVITVL